MDKDNNGVNFNDILLNIEREKIDILYKQNIPESLRKKPKKKNAFTNTVSNFIDLIHSWIE